MAIQAPWTNFVRAVTTSTRPVAIAPTPLIDDRDGASPVAPRSPFRRSRSQWRTMPVCDSVNAVNTPTMYSWISLSRFASNATIRTQATSDSTTMPFE